MSIKSCKTCSKAKRCNKDDVVRNMPCIDYKEVKRNVDVDDSSKSRS